jgi:DNA-binding transcriptional LysR family regulator
MVLTQAGHRFQSSARKVISAVAEAGRIDRGEPEALTGSLTLGVTSLVAGYYLADLFARFQRSHPSVHLSVVEDSPPFLEHLLVNGEVDVAVMVSNALGDPQALVVELLTRSPNRVWLSSSHPLAERPELTLAECAAVPQVVLEADRVESVLRAVWARYGHHPDVVLRTSSLEAVRSLVGVGAGITMLPDFLYGRRRPGLAPRHPHAGRGGRIHRHGAGAVGGGSPQLIPTLLVAWDPGCRIG